MTQNDNLGAIIRALAAAPDGLWIREIARRTKLAPMTISYHVSKHPELFDVKIIGSERPLFRLVRLRRGALSKPGALLTRILAEQGAAR